MRLVIQRVQRASVTVNGETVGSIGSGLMILVGIETADTVEELEWIAAKTASMRIFNDENGVMNRSVTDCHRQILAISQFTLTASTRKGNRPSYIRAARPEEAERFYDLFCEKLSALTATKVQKGVFGADMKVELINDGPVTIIIDSRLKE